MKNEWKSVLFLWGFCLLFTGAVFLRRMDIREEAAGEVTEPESVAMVLQEEETMILGKREDKETEEFSAENFAMSSAEKIMVTSKAEDTEPFSLVEFQPETHVAVVTEPETTEKRTEPVTAIITQSVQKPPETIPSEEKEEELPAESQDALRYRYLVTSVNGNQKKESFRDSFTVSFQRTRSGEAMSFDYVTYDDRWIDALSREYPLEDPGHAAMIKEKLRANGSVYSYCVSNFRGGVSYINVLPDDRLVVVEEAGKEGFRYYAADGYRAETVF